MFKLDFLEKPPAATAAATAPIGSLFSVPLDMFRKSPCPPKPVAESVATARLTSYLQTRAWAWLATAKTDAGNVDLHKTAKLLVIAHMRNKQTRVEMARNIGVSDLELETLEEDAEFFSFSDPPQAADGRSGPSAPLDVLVALFDDWRLPEYTTNCDEGRLDFKYRHLTLAPARDRVLPNTKHFVRFQQGLIGELSACEVPSSVRNSAYYDSVLLYFTCLALADKNAAALLALPHFDYLSWPLRTGAGQSNGSRGTVRDYVLQFLRRNNPRLDLEMQATVDKNGRVTKPARQDYNDRIEPVEKTWEVFFQEMCFRNLNRYATAGAKSDSGTTAGGADKEDADEEDDDDEEDADEEDETPAPPLEQPLPFGPAPPLPPRPSAQQPSTATSTTTTTTTTPAAPSRDLDFVAEGPAPAAPSRDQEAVAAELVRSAIAAPFDGKCAVHNYGLGTTPVCSQMCVTQRLGAPHTRSAEETQQMLHTPLMRQAKLQLGSNDYAGRLVAATLLQQQPQVALAMVGAQRMPSMLPRTSAEWQPLLRSFNGAAPAAGRDLEGVDALAKYAGWLTLPAGERAKRYVAAYSNIGADRMWTANAWAPLSDKQLRRVAAYRQANPTPGLRTVQVLMHLASRDEA